MSKPLNSVLLAGLACVGCSCRDSTSQQPIVAVIDSEVPGTKVYLRGQLLGVVPVELTRTRLDQLGLKPPADVPNAILDTDGWGQGIFFGEEDRDEEKVMLQVPESDTAKYLIVETPWGRRTTICGGTGGQNPQSFKARMFAKDQDGLQLQIMLPGTIPLGTQTVIIELQLTNRGASAVTGHHSDILLQWGTFDTPWRMRTRKRISLPAEWSSIAPGQTLTPTAEVDVPSVAENYSFFATFDLFTSDRGDQLVRGSVYSDSRLLRVR